MLDKDSINLMPYQWVSFNNDSFIASEFINLRDKFNVTTVIETGTCLGSSTRWFSKNFKRVFSTEVNKEYAQYASERLFKDGLRNWQIVAQKSEDCLGKIIDLVKTESVLIFLDAHWLNSCPLERELEIIAESGLRPIIAIHDFKVPGNPEFGFDSYNGQDFTFEWLKSSFDKIYGEDGFDFYYNTGIVEYSAKRGIIYITPKIIMDKKTFIDIGCNIGYYTSIWMKDPNNIIYAFEPEPNLYKALVEKYKGNKNVKVFDYAISEVDGEMPFYVHRNLCNSSLKKVVSNDDYDNYDESDIITVRTKRMDTFIKENNIQSIDLLKSDTQGSDLDVIKSMGDELGIVKQIMAEAFLDNEKDIYENEVKESELIEYLENNGFVLFNKSVDGNYADFIFNRK